MSKIVDVKNLETHFISARGTAKAVDRVSLSLEKGEILGMVGESGCGKSITALSILRLIAPPGKIVGGEIFFDGRDLLRLTEREMERVRGNRVSMIFQDPMTSLNPLFTVGNQIMEPLMIHRGLSKKEARSEAVHMLEKVGIPLPRRRVDEYPNSMSGGMLQRVMIAMALCCHPEVLLADEPTTALDVTIQAQILDLMKKLRDDMGTAILMITHDMGVVAELCDRAAVMYCGSVVEEGPVGELFTNPIHPYTIGLMDSIPTLDGDVRRLYNIHGTVPNLLSLPSGCRFADRCERCEARCRMGMPELAELSPGHFVRCFVRASKTEEGGFQ